MADTSDNTVSITGYDPKFLDLDLLLFQAQRKGGFTIVPSEDCVYLALDLQRDGTIRVKEKMIDSGDSDYATYSLVDDKWVCLSRDHINYDRYGIDDNIGSPPGSDQRRQRRQRHRHGIVAATTAATLAGALCCGVKGCPRTHTLAEHRCSVCRGYGHGAHSCKYRCQECKRDGEFNNRNSCPIHGAT
jgi:hypothetical protein